MLFVHASCKPSPEFDLGAEKPLCKVQQQQARGRTTGGSDGLAENTAECSGVKNGRKTG